MKQSTRLLFSAWIVVLLGGAQSAYAQTVEPPHVVVLDGETTRLRVKVNPDHPTVLRFKSRLTTMDHVEWPRFTVLKKPGDVLVLHAEIIKRGEWGEISCSDSRL